MTEDLTPSLLEEFNKILKDPGKRAELLRKSELQDFKDTFNVERASPLRCPACSQYGQSGGSLWRVKNEKSKFVCRKCHKRFNVEWLDGDIDELILSIKEANK